LLGSDPEPIAHVSDRLVVMCRGRIVETGTVEDVMRAPLHPYANALLANVVQVTAGKRVFVPVLGDAPSTTAQLRGCPFHTRCPHVVAVCREVPPVLATTPQGRQCACHRELASSRGIAGNDDATGKAT
jgi:oligopeptide/dipeptide ABC transporter ATP-binding protein